MCACNILTELLTLLRATKAMSSTTLIALDGILTLAKIQQADLIQAGPTLTIIIGTTVMRLGLRHLLVKSALVVD